MASDSKVIQDWEKKQKFKDRWYFTKTIEFFGRSTPIVLQHRNGPCPLLAICNILLLRNKMSLSADVAHVSESELLKLVAKNILGSFSNDENMKTITDAIDILPLLVEGLNVNIKFNRIDDIELTRESAVFSLLDIPLYHGWLIDPQDSETSNAIGSKSYDTLMGDLAGLKIQNMEALSMKKFEEDITEHLGKDIVEYLEKDYTGEEQEPLIGLKLTETVDPTSSKIRHHGDLVTFESKDEQMNTGESSNEVPESSMKMTDTKSSSSTTTSNVNEGEVGITAREGELIQNFLDNNATQLTVYGLFCLREGLKEHEICVFYRNNHLNTMIKFGGALYILATDVGYMLTPGVVWEKLSEVNGDTVFVNKNFRIYEPEIQLCSSDEESSDPHAKAFEELLSEGKKWQQESEETQQLRTSPARFPSGFIVGPEREYSVWPPNPPRKPSRKNKKGLKEKCKLM